MSEAFPFWNSLHDLFDKDDGSFPEILINRLGGPGVIRGYSHIREKTKFLVGAPAFTGRRDGREKLLDSVPNAAEVVVSGAAEPFHFLARQIVVDAGIIPELGVFIFENAIALDYQMGRQWSESTLEALFSLVRFLVRNGENPVVTHEESDRPMARQRFEAAISRYLETPDEPFPKAVTGMQKRPI
ncbi:MAG: hypothetical protein WA705_27220 [Candidatus Ozemobacteraceae bacterium]